MSETEAVIRRLVPADAEAFVQLRRQALDQEPLAFGASPEDDLGLVVDTMRQRLAADSTSPTFGAFAPNLVGITGLYREEKLKLAHKAHVWGVFVDPGHQGNGLGRRLLEAAIAHARTVDGLAQLHLSVAEDATAAERLYTKLGFRRWGTEPNALRWQGRSVAEHHMVLSLT